MVFNSNKGFFLTLDDAAAPATLDLPQTEAPRDEEATAEESVATTAVAATESSTPAVAEPATAEIIEATKPEQTAQPAASITTAEAIAAELATAEAARPAVTYFTFAPGNLMPGGGLRQRSRRPGASMKSFRGIAQDLFKS